MKRSKFSFIINVSLFAFNFCHNSKVLSMSYTINCLFICSSYWHPHRYQIPYSTKLWNQIIQSNDTDACQKIVGGGHFVWFDEHGMTCCQCVRGKRIAKSSPKPSSLFIECCTLQYMPRHARGVTVAFKLKGHSWRFGVVGFMGSEEILFYEYTGTVSKGVPGYVHLPSDNLWQKNFRTIFHQ